MQQIIVKTESSANELERLLEQYKCKKYLLVCGSSFDKLPIKEWFDAINVPCARFDKFTPNPLYEDVCKGVEIFKREGCDAIVAIGGGSSIDVAKCIKLFSAMRCDRDYFEQESVSSKTPLIAIPTTAGSGSEATRYAVIYHNYKKQSIANESIIPNAVILDHRALSTLPIYQKKCAMLDALCQGIESMWSLNSTDESKKYSESAIRAILENYRSYIFDNDEDAAERIMLAANCSGKAINITQTTAAHAMSYKLTSIYKIPHGHAVALCLPRIWEYMLEEDSVSSDSRGKEYVMTVFDEIARLFGERSVRKAIAHFDLLLRELEIVSPYSNDRINDLCALTESVNAERLKNNPMILSNEAIYNLYSIIVKQRGNNET